MKMITSNIDACMCKQIFLYFNPERNKPAHIKQIDQGVSI